MWARYIHLGSLFLGFRIEIGRRHIYFPIYCFENQYFIFFEEWIIKDLFCILKSNSLFRLLLNHSLNQLSRFGWKLVSIKNKGSKVHLIDIGWSYSIERIPSINHFKKQKTYTINIDWFVIRLLLYHLRSQILITSTKLVKHLVRL